MSLVFPGNKKKCVTFSYDDGPDQDVELIRILDEHGMKGTFNLITQYVGAGAVAFNHLGLDVAFTNVTEAEIPVWYKNHEVASHGQMHLPYTTLSREELREEVLQNVAYLERVTGRKMTGGAYPGGDYSANVAGQLREMGLKYYRTIQDTYDFALPADFLQWHPTCHDNDDRAPELAERFLAQDSEQPQVFFIWGHAYEFDKTDRDRWGNFRRLCDRLAAREDIWFATNGELCEWVLSRQEEAR